MLRLSRTAETTRLPNARQRETKAFWFFFQKRTAFSPYAACNTCISHNLKNRPTSASVVAKLVTKRTTGRLSPGMSIHR